MKHTLEDNYKLEKVQAPLSGGDHSQKFKPVSQVFSLLQVE